MRVSTPYFILGSPILILQFVLRMVPRVKFKHVLWVPSLIPIQRAERTKVPWEFGERVRVGVTTIRVTGLSKNLFQETFTRMNSWHLVPSSSSNCRRTGPSGDFGYFISCSVAQLAVCCLKLRSSNCNFLEDRNSILPWLHVEGMLTPLDYLQYHSFSADTPYKTSGKKGNPTIDHCL